MSMRKGKAPSLLHRSIKIPNRCQTKQFKKDIPNVTYQRAPGPHCLQRNVLKLIKRNALPVAKVNSLFRTPGKQSWLVVRPAGIETVNHDILTSEQYRSRGNSRKPLPRYERGATAVEREGSYDPGITTGIFCDYSCS